MNNKKIKKINKILLVILLSLIIVFILIYFNKERMITITKFEVPSIIYIAKNGEEKLDILIQEKNNKEVSLKYEIDNKKILEINNNTIKGLKDGTTKVTVQAGNEEKELTVVVTSLITKEELNNNNNNNKPYLTCNLYTNEEANLLEEILENRINTAGYQTRGGALAAARFLLLEFKNGIKYFNENGRLENHSSIKKIDGEGRYYHLGLYITEEDYSEITLSTSEPKMWGCSLYNTHKGIYMENGLNCSGFITWALLNAGYDIKDVGAGDYTYIKNELLDIEPKEEITLELLQSNLVKSGDLIGFDGHIAMIIGLEKNKVYIGESYETGLRVLTFTYEELISSEFTHIILMDEYYKEEGKYSNMW